MRRAAVLVICVLILGFATPLRAEGTAVNQRAPGCRVQDLVTHAEYTSSSTVNPVQTAIDAASSGAVLQIAGACLGNLSITRDLTLRGRPTRYAPAPTLDGNGAATVVNSVAARLTISGLTITHGSAQDAGGGIYNAAGTVTLVNSTVSGNTAVTGGGIYNAAGTVTLVNSTVSGNSAGQFHTGGGIYNASGRVSLVNSIVRGNSSNSAAGIFNDTGTVTLTFSSVRDNTATFQAGGIFNSSGNLEITRSTVSGNTAYASAGIFNFSGHVRITGSTVNANSAVQLAGGIYNQAGDVIVASSTVSGNSAGLGGGIANGGTMTLANSRAIRNSATSTAAGVLNAGGSLTLVGDTRIQWNTAGDSGGGIASTSGTVSVSRWTGSVFRNTPDNCSPALTLGGRICN